MSRHDDSIEAMIRAIEPFKDAVSILKQKNYADILNSSLIDSIDMVNSALTQGVFDTVLSTNLQEMYMPLKEFQIMSEALGNSLVKPDVYENISSALLAISDHIGFIDRQSAIMDMAGGLSAIASASQSIVDTTWFHDKNIWTVARTALSEIDTTILSTGELSKLVRLEYETSLINNPALEMITSAASQISSIMETFAPGPQISRLLLDYAEYASIQHNSIQQAQDDQEEIRWRLAAIDAASRFVDRQVKWTEAFSDEISEYMDCGESEYGEFDIDSPSCVSQIGYHIGYSKRKNSAVTPEEALEQSSIVEITERGKTISENIVIINKIMKDNGQEDVFKYSDHVATALINLSTIVCTSDDQMGTILDDLYILFYENIKHIKLIVGEGNLELGDQIVRDEDIYQCIFNIKTIRNDYRHDLSHGNEAEVRKKLTNIGDCYKSYCKHRPLRAKDYKMFQLNLYNELLQLEAKLIEKAEMRGMEGKKTK